MPTGRVSVVKDFAGMVFTSLKEIHLLWINASSICFLSCIAKYWQFRHNPRFQKNMDSTRWRTWSLASRAVTLKLKSTTRPTVVHRLQKVPPISPTCIFQKPHASEQWKWKMEPFVHQWQPHHIFSSLPSWVNKAHLRGILRNGDLTAKSRERHKPITTWMQQWPPMKSSFLISSKVWRTFLFFRSLPTRTTSSATTRTLWQEASISTRELLSAIASDAVGNVPYRLNWWAENRTMTSPSIVVSVFMEDMEDFLRRIQNTLSDWNSSQNTDQTNWAIPFSRKAVRRISTNSCCVATLGIPGNIGTRLEEHTHSMPATYGHETCKDGWDTHIRVDCTSIFSSTDSIGDSTI